MQNILFVSRLLLVLMAFANMSIAQTTKSTKRTISINQTKNGIFKVDSYVSGIDKYIKKYSGKKLVLANMCEPADCNNWRKFKSEEEAYKDESIENPDIVYVWIRDGKMVAAGFTFQSPSGDWAHFVYYYFRENGRLAKVDAQLNTFYGNMTVNRLLYYDEKGKLLKKATTYLDMKTKKPQKPGRHFVDEPLIIYRNAKHLPFYKQIEKSKT